MNESIVKSVNLFLGTHDIYFTTSQAGYYLVKLEARDPLGHTSTYNLALTIAEEKLDTLTTTTPITVQTPYTTTPITTVTTIPTQQVQVAEVHAGYESTAVPLWLILLIILLIISATVLTFLLLRRRKSGKKTKIVNNFFLNILLLARILPCYYSAFFSPIVLDDVICKPC